MPALNTARRTAPRPSRSVPASTTIPTIRPSVGHTRPTCDSAGPRIDVGQRQSRLRRGQAEAVATSAQHQRVDGTLWMPEVDVSMRVEPAYPVW